MDNKKVVGQRINAALAMRDKKQKELARAIGVTDNTISYFCSGTRSPNLQQIIAIAKELDVSSDYLLGLSDIPSIDKDIQAVCKTTGLSGDAVLTLGGLPPEECDELNFLLTCGPFRGFLKKLNEYRGRWASLLQEEQREREQAEKYEKDGKHYVFTAPENRLYKELLECSELNLHKCVSAITAVIDAGYKREGE